MAVRQVSEMCFLCEARNGYTKRMIHVEYQKEKRLLRLTFEGRSSVRDFEDLFSLLETVTPQLEKGFRVLTDLSKLESPSLETRGHIAELMKLLDKHGVSEIVRVIPDAERDIGLNIMSLFHYGPGVKIRTVESCDQV